MSDSRPVVAVSNPAPVDPPVRMERDLARARNGSLIIPMGRYVDRDTVGYTFVEIFDPTESKLLTGL